MEKDNKILRSVCGNPVNKKPVVSTLNHCIDVDIVHIVNNAASTLRLEVEMTVNEQVSSRSLVLG